MKNEMMVFEGREVEVFEFDGQILFNPRHVAECLDIADVNSSIRDMSDRQMVKLTNSDVHTMHIRKLNNAGENFLTESGVYKLIFKSRKPEAEKFQDWITDEVLPSIRETDRETVCVLQSVLVLVLKRSLLFLFVLVCFHQCQVRFFRLWIFDYPEVLAPFRQGF